MLVKAIGYKGEPLDVVDATAGLGRDAVTLALVGCSGRMGRFCAELLRSNADFELAAELDAKDDLAAVLTEARPDVALDFTVAGRGFEHGRICLAAGVRPVIGTSGVSAPETAELDELARKRGLGGLVVPNFSLGVWLQQRACVDLARLVPDWELEVLELHHERKRDAPSGTSVHTAERLAAASNRSPADVPIRSVRGPGLYAHQEIRLAGKGELLRIRHDMHGPEAFGPGILLALERATRIVGIERGIGAALEARLSGEA